MCTKQKNQQNDNFKQKITKQNYSKIAKRYIHPVEESNLTRITYLWEEVLELERRINRYFVGDGGDFDAGFLRLYGDSIFSFQKNK